MSKFPSINLQLLDKIKAKMIREAFLKKFVMTKERFQIVHKNWLEQEEKRGHPFQYEKSLMWDRMPTYQNISFEDAINFLKTYNNDILLMSENESYPHCERLLLYNKEYKGFVAKANALELAELIYFEWYDSWRLISQYMYRDDYILPSDLYVFDENMQFMIVFTHENDNWEAEIDEPMKAAKARICIAYGVKNAFKKR